MTPPTKTPSNRTLLVGLARALEVFGKHREEVPTHVVLVFLIIAQRKGITAAELARLTGLGASSISRNVQALGMGKGGEAGLGVVIPTIDPKNPRAHVIRLTAKGVVLAREMAAEVGGVLPARSAQTFVEQAPSEAVDGKPASTQHLHWENWMD